MTLTLVYAAMFSVYITKRISLTTQTAIHVETVDEGREVVQATTGEDPRASVRGDVTETERNDRRHDVTSAARAEVAVLQAVMLRAQAASTHNRHTVSLHNAN